MNDRVTPSPLRPLVRRWCVLFHETTDHPLVNRMVRGRYKHVSALGVFSSRTMVHVNPGLFRTWVEVIEGPDTMMGMAALDRIMTGATVVEMSEVPMEARAPMVRGGWCIPAVAALVGLRPGWAGVFFPDAFLRTCLENGGRIVEEPDGPPD